MRKSRLYILIAILTTILVIALVIAILFVTSILSFQCTPEGGEEAIIKEEAEAEEDEAEEVEGETREEEIGEEEVEKAEVEASDEEETEEDEEEDAEEKTAPTIELEIYQDATLEGSICYWRVKAVITGYPEPDIEWNRDDSSGSFGKAIAQVNLNDPSETFTLTATAANSVDTATDSITLSWGCEEVEENNPPQITGINLSDAFIGTGMEYEVSAIASDPDGDSLSYNWSVEGGTLSDVSSNPTSWTTPGSEGHYDLTVVVNDGKGGTDTYTKHIYVALVLHMPVSVEIHPSDIGYIVYPTGVNTTELIIGDSISNTDVQGFFAFDLSSIEDKRVLEAELYLNTYRYYPDPSFKGKIFIGFMDYLPLDPGDYSFSLITGYFFNNTQNPIEITGSTLIDIVQENADAGEKFQLIIAYLDLSSDGDHTVDGREYSKASITLKILYD